MLPQVPQITLSLLWKMGNDNDDINNENVFVYLDIEIGQEKSGRIVLELFKNLVPKTVENFRALCSGEKDVGINGKPLHYKGTVFHRVVPQFMVQCGDIINYDGSGGQSIYGNVFDDENFLVSHSTEGIVGMANAGPNTNSSQFYITTVPCTHLDGRNVAFGKVRKGLNIVREIQELPRRDEMPLIKCTIEDCGVLQPGEPWNIQEDDGTEDIYPPYPDDWETGNFENVDKEFANAITNIKESGNMYYYKNNYTLSEKKYKKSLRYVDYWLSKRSNKDQCIIEMKVVALLNLSAVKLKRQSFYDVIKLCTEVLSLDPKNHKALYRRGQAKMKIKEYREAIYDFKDALKLQPNNRALQSEIKGAKLCLSNYTKKEKELFAKMF